MPYRAGDFYMQNVQRAGDYYRAGGGGLFRSLLGVASGFIPGGGIISTGVRAISGLMAGSRPSPAAAGQAGLHMALTSPAPRGRRKEAGIKGLVHRLVPGGKTGYLKIHRAMKVTNPKALKRAERRIRGFEKLAKRVLRPLGLHVVRHTCRHPSHRRGRR